MAKVKAKVKCFIDSALREEGEIFEYCGPENECIEPIEEIEAIEVVLNSETPRRGPGRPRQV